MCPQNAFTWYLLGMLSCFSRVRLCRLPGSSVHGILQARILKWIAMPHLQGIFLTQGLNIHLFCLLHWSVGSLYQCHPGSPFLCLFLYSFRTSSILLTICHIKFVSCDLHAYSVFPVFLL